MTRHTSYVPFPPQSMLLAIGPGKLTAVSVPGPEGKIENTLNTGPGYLPLQNTYAIDALVYDAVSREELSAPVAHLHGPVPDDAPIVFTKGLYIVQQSGSSLTFTYQRTPQPKGA